MDKRNLKAGAAQLLSLFFPNTCLCCDRMIRHDELICPICAAHLERMDAAKRCLACGLPKTRCQCRGYAYHFAAVIAPFYNIGLARRAVYRYKFHRRKRNARFLSAEMAKAVQKEYADIPFSGVAFVPTSRKHIFLRGFDQAERLAERTAKQLGLPFLADALVHLPGGKTQHKLSREERFRSVRGFYKGGMPLSGNVLLADDIKTTGATLDECARQLLLAGADKVYCVTAAISDMNMEIEDEYVAAVCKKR